MSIDQNQNQSQFEIVEKNKLFEIGEKKGYKFYKQLDFNLAYVYKKDNKYMLFPQEGKNGIWYFNKNLYVKDISRKKFPINEDPVNLYDRDRKIILDFKFEIFSKKLINNEIVPNKEVYTFEDFIDISSNLNDLKSKGELTDEIYYQLGYFMAECFRKQIEGIWNIEARYTFNLYWLPQIKDVEGKIFGVNFWKMPEEQKIINLNKIMLLELAQFYKIPVFSKEHAEFVNGKW